MHSRRGAVYPSFPDFRILGESCHGLMQGLCSRSMRPLTIKSNPFRRWCYGGWLVLIAVFAVLHAVHLSADFPNHSEWIFDWAKYTDEGW